MKCSLDDAKASCSEQQKSKIKRIWDKQVYKLKHGTFTCPFCREGFKGLSAFGSHLKAHCT